MSATHWKMVYLARRNPRLAPEEFPQAWREHSSLGRQCHNVQDRVHGVTQCVRLLAYLSPDASTAYDGVNLLQLRDRESADAIWSDPETLAIMRPDEPRVFDRYVRECALVAQEQVLQAGPAGNAVLLAFLKRRATVAPADFERALRLHTKPWDAVQSTVLNLVEPERPTGYDYDAIVEWWFQDEAGMIRSIAGRSLADALPVLYLTVCDFTASVFLPTRVSHRRP
ncbi:MAG: EthD domain-containing protein [Proteobacteria bacterium]|nr:EthD domain-containing protein [Pseudomonadota bacterium]MBS0494487.1 EthD domain-containing protein [Pseudomonadota bacterium]